MKTVVLVLVSLAYLAVAVFCGYMAWEAGAARSLVGVIVFAFFAWLFGVSAIAVAFMAAGTGERGKPDALPC